MALIKNNEDRVHSLMGRFTLMPGINEVPDEVWKDLQKQSGVKRLLASKVLTQERATSHAQTGATATTSAETDLNKLAEEDAVRLVGETVDRTLLTKWGQSARGPVKEAIEQQMAAISMTPEERESALKKRGGK
jgi:hypothetical protein